MTIGLGTIQITSSAIYMYIIYHFLPCTYIHVRIYMYMHWVHGGCFYITYMYDAYKMFFPLLFLYIG